MFKSLLFIALILCATTILRTSCALEKATIVRHLSIGVSNSSTVPFKGHLYTISKNDSHIHVNSTDINHNPCDIEIIDPAREVITGDREVIATDQEIYLVGVKSISQDRDYTYTILRIDPIACNYQAANIPETSGRRGFYFLPRLVRRPIGTDVFFPDLKKCAPCRLDNGGLRDTGSVSQLPREYYEAGVPFQIQYDNATNTYFYIFNIQTVYSRDENSALKLLDGNDFKTVKQRSLMQPVHAISTKRSSTGDLGICSKIYDVLLSDVKKYEELQCDRLNSTLDTINTIQISMGSESKFISRISYEFDEEGNSYIGFSEDTQLRLYIHDKDGKLVKALDLGEIDERFKQYGDIDTEFFFNPNDYWDVRGYLVGDQYCIITEQVSTIYAAPLHDVKCVDVKKSN